MVADVSIVLYCSFFCIAHICSIIVIVISGGSSIYVFNIFLLFNLHSLVVDLYYYYYYYYYYYCVWCTSGFDFDFF
jgi:hypothetical protein